MEKVLGTENIEKVGSALSKLVVAGKKIAADKKVNAEDLQHALPVLMELPVFIEAFGAFGKAIEEGKDLDVTEIVELIQFVHKKVKEIEAA